MSNEFVKPSTQDTGGVGSIELAIALIGPVEQRRREVAVALAGSISGVTREFAAYPDLDELPRLLELNYDVVIIDLDSNPEYALDLVESICGSSTATVMVYSAQANSELTIRCMRAGVREFLTSPITPGAITEAMIRTSVRRPVARAPQKTGGKMSVFFGAKGGSGVTTLACNFAILLARESDKKTLLIDLDLPLGDAALGLGITSQYSIADALQNYTRLDSSYLSMLLCNYSTNLSVLTSPGKFINMCASKEALGKLLTIARQEFDYVVVDAGSRPDAATIALFEESATFYLITRVGIPELRNSNRLITEFFASELPKLEIVLNRFASSTLGVDDEQITKALTRSAHWKVANDYASFERMQNSSTPLVLRDSPISQTILQMARTACGLPPKQEKKKGLIALFG